MYLKQPPYLLCFKTIFFLKSSSYAALYAYFSKVGIVRLIRIIDKSLVYLKHEMRITSGKPLGYTILVTYLVVFIA